MVRMGEMLEYTYVNGNAYGTTKKSVEEARARGKNVILDVDTIGAMKIRALCPDATLIYILPPSWDELKSRLYWNLYRRRSECFNGNSRRRDFMCQ